MADAVRGEVACAPSEAVVAREIEGEIVIVPLTAGIGDLEDELYSLNATGRDVWRLLAGRTLEVVDALLAEYDEPREEIDRDVRGLLGELLTRGIVRGAEQRMDGSLAEAPGGAAADDTRRAAGTG